MSVQLGAGLLHQRQKCLFRVLSIAPLLLNLGLDLLADFLERLNQLNLLVFSFVRHILSCSGQLEKGLLEGGSDGRVRVFSLLHLSLDCFFQVREVLPNALFDNLKTLLPSVPLFLNVVLEDFFLFPDAVTDALDAVLTGFGDVGEPFLQKVLPLRDLRLTLV